VSRAAALALAVSLLAACTGGAGGDGPPGEPSGRLRLLTFGDPEEVQGFRDLEAAFEERHPQVDVELVVASDREDLLARLSTSFAGGRPPDLFLINYRYLGQFAARDVLAPLGPRVDASEVFDRDDFYEEAMEAFRWEGEQVCLPQNISSLVVYFNRDLFEAAGVPLPEAGWTWDEMVERAAALTRDTDGDGLPEVYGLGARPEIIQVAPFVWSAGGELVDDPERPTRFTLDTPQAREALQAFFDLRLVHQVIPTEEDAESEDDESRFLNGRLAMVMSSRRSTPVFRTIEDFAWDVAPLPVRDEQATILHSDAYCMTRASENQETAWAFVEFALGPEGAPITAATGRTVPSLTEVAESPVFLEPELPPANARAFLDTIPDMRRVPNISTWPEIEVAVEPLLEEGLFEGLPVSQVLASIDRATRQIFARAEV
jgi:multiple sugar transport system substrate-binding protein